jgi:hypothetical protein
MEYSPLGRMGPGSTHTGVAGLQAGRNQVLVDLVRAAQPVGTWVVVVGTANVAVHKLRKVLISVTGKRPGKEK